MLSSEPRHPRDTNQLDCVRVAVNTAISLLLICSNETISAYLLPGAPSLPQI